MIEHLNDLANLVNDVATANGWERASITIQDDGAAFISGDFPNSPVKVESLEHLSWMARGSDPSEFDEEE